jgi:hypothetical protein
MRPTLSFRLALAGNLMTSAVIAGTGLSPRADTAQYDVHQTVNSGAIGAAILSPEKVTKIFAADVRKRYVVVEVGVFPENGNAIDLTLIDFALKTPDDRSFPAAPAEVAWHGKRPPSPSVSSPGVNVVAEAGVGYGTRTNPATGRTDKGLATWAGAEVDNAPRPNPPANSAGDTYALEGRLRSSELPEGRTTQPVAGYLYFPAARTKAKNPTLNLEYSHNGERVDLSLRLR